MTAATIRRDVHEGVVTVVVDAPARGNSLDPALLTELEAALRDLPAGARVVVLRGAGQRHFSTGYHLPSLMDELARGPSVVDFDHHPLERALRALDEVPVPTLAVLHGDAYGAGCELALTCDLRLCAHEARLCMPPARLGILYSATGMRRLLGLVGPAVTRELLFTAEAVDGLRAHELGLVNRSVPRAELDELAARTVERIAAGAPLALRHTKTVLRRFLEPPELDAAALRLVAALREECFRSDEFQQRARAALERLGGGG